MSEVKSRGVKKGETPAWNVGRKKTGLARNERIMFRVTEEEKEKIFKILDEIGGTRTEALIEIMEAFKK